VLDREEAWLSGWGEAWLRGREAARLLEARDGVELPPSPPGTVLKSRKIFLIFAVLGIRMFFGLPDPDPLVRG
jgi:hypothetical protein